jgi:hypothetical protein
MGYPGVFGPFFFNENINGMNYLEMLKHSFLPVVQHILAFGQTIFMQDGAPPTGVEQFVNF